MDQVIRNLKITLFVGLMAFSLAFYSSDDNVTSEQLQLLKNKMITHETLFKEVDQIVSNHEPFTEDRIEEVQRQIEEERIKAEQERLRQEQEQLINSVGTLGYNLGFTPADIDLLNRLVEAEAGGEPYNGKIAVVNVVLNRIRSEKFPNDLKGVIYQANQFEVVSIGTIDTKTPSDSTKNAVKDALNGVKAVGDDILYFWAKSVHGSHDIWKHCIIKNTIGGHHFSDRWG